MGRGFGKRIRNRIATSNPLLREFLAELLGTFCLMVSRDAFYTRFYLRPANNVFNRS